MGLSVGWRCGVGAPCKTFQHRPVKHLQSYRLGETISALVSKPSLSASGGPANARAPPVRVSDLSVRSQRLVEAANAISPSPPKTAPRCADHKRHPNSPP